MPMKRNQELQRAVLCAVLVFGLGSVVHAGPANRTWDGGGANNNWMTAANWDAVPGNGDGVIFSGTTRLINTNNFSGATDFRLITFNSGAGAFVLNGNAIDLTGNVTNNSTTLQTINLNLNMMADRTYTIVTNGTLLINGIVSGASFDMVKAGTGTMILAGTNTYAGTTNSAGTLQIGNGGTTGTLGTGAVVNNAALDFDRSNAITVGNLISGTGSLTQSGAGTTTLTNANTYSGATVISAGTLQVGNGGDSGSLGTNEIVNNAVLAFNRSNAITVSNLISGIGSLTKMGANTGTLTRANTFSGQTAIQGGALVASNTLALQNSTVIYTNNGGALIFASGITSYTLGGLTGNKNLALTNVGGTAVALTVGKNDADTTYSGALSAGGSLIKTGAGRLTLGGTNTYTGLTTIEAGTLAFSSASNFVGTSGITFSAGLDSTLYATADGITLNKTMTQTAPGNYRIDAGNTLTLGGLITGGGQFRKEGDGTIILNGTNDYSGRTVINGGTLRLGTSGSIGAVNMDVVNGTFDLNGKSKSLTDLTLGSTNGSTAGTITSGLGVLTVNGSMAFRAGTVAAKLAGTAAMTKSSTGTVYLTGASTYTNITTVSLGSLIVNGSLQSKNIAVESGATLSGTGTVQAVTMKLGSQLAVGDSFPGSTGTMNFNADLLLEAGSTNRMEISSASQYDILKGNGANTVAAYGLFTFDFTGNTTVTNGSSFAVLQNWGARTTGGATYSSTGLSGGLSVDTSQMDIGLVTVIPEPATALLFGFFGISAWLMRRNKI